MMLPVVSIVVPFLGLPYRILIIYLVKPKKGTTMETIGRFKVWVWGIRLQVLGPRALGL